MRCLIPYELLDCSPKSVQRVKQECLQPSHQGSHLNDLVFDDASSAKPLPKGHLVIRGILEDLADGTHREKKAIGIISEGLEAISTVQVGGYFGIGDRKKKSISCRSCRGSFDYGFRGRYLAHLFSGVYERQNCALPPVMGLLVL